MIQDIHITILIEDTTSKMDLKTEHGLSFWIEYDGKSILFDTGQSDVLIQNAAALDINLANSEAVVISHGHYDHTGGLQAVLDIATKTKIYVHPKALEQKFRQKSLGAKLIGMPNSAKKAIQSRHVIWTVTPAEIFPGVLVTGQVPRWNDYEDVGGAFFVDNDCVKPDKLLDDQAMFIESTKGTVVILGCSHAGVVNTLDYISKLTNNKKIYAVIGGMHLINAKQIRINHTIEAFKNYDIQKYVPLHCTGMKAKDDLKNVFGDKCLFLGNGEQISF
jgi:7,8-dihydropterin-6-yl-methyl-4-(beta-D-ribofuranosyl)aminobenzene 5'-phosphate synthase